QQRREPSRRRAASCLDGELGGRRCERPGKARRGRGREATRNERSAGCVARERGAGRAGGAPGNSPANARGLAAGNGVHLIIGESDHYVDFWHVRSFRVRCARLVLGLNAAAEGEVCFQVPTGTLVPTGTETR